MSEFIWRKSKIRDALSGISEITSVYQNKSETFIYKVNDENSFNIFSNLSQFKKSINFIQSSLKSDQRCRMSFEVKGQPRTGKTLCSKYVLPYFCAKIINRQRELEGLAHLSRAPVLYIMMEKNGNPIRALYNELKDRLSGIIKYHQEQELKDNGELILELQKIILQFFDVYSDSHMFIILDEIQLIDSKYLDSLRITIKSRDFMKCTFILTGSTSMFNVTMSQTYRNGLSYFDNKIVYEIPFNNTKKCVEESLKVLFDSGVLKRSSITSDEARMIMKNCTALNVAYVSQILKYEHDLKLPFKNSLHKLFEEIIKKYERDVDIESTMILKILTGDFEYLEETFLVTTINGRLALKDKLFTLFLHRNYTLSENNKVIKKRNRLTTEHVFKSEIENF